MLEKFSNLSTKQKLFILLGGLLLLGIILFIFYPKNESFDYTQLDANATIMKNVTEDSSINDEETIINTTSSSLSETFGENSEEMIIVHITGHVVCPGVVILPEGARINDAIKACDGASSDADLANINLAYVLEDGQKVYIPSYDDIKKAKKEQEEISTDRYITQDAGDTVLVEEQGTSSTSSNSGSSKSSTSSSTRKGNSTQGDIMININTATQTELEMLPGIGPSTALKILDYRKEHGKFDSVDDIKNVKGIGDAKFENIKDHICIK